MIVFAGNLKNAGKHSDDWQVLLRAVGAPAIKQVLFEAWATTGIAVSLLVIGAVGILEVRKLRSYGSLSLPNL